MEDKKMKSVPQSPLTIRTMPLRPVESAAVPPVVKKDRMLIVEPVHGDMYDLETNTRIPKTEGAAGTRVKHSGFLQCQIDAGKIAVIDG